MTYEEWMINRRYRVYRSDARDWNIKETVANGLELAAALAKSAELQKAEDRVSCALSSWGKTLFNIELETEKWNPELNRVVS